MSRVDLKVPAFTDLQDYQRTLATLREPSLLVEIAENSLALDAPRMRAAIDAGVFDAQPFIDVANADPTSLYPLQTQWSKRCEAMMTVMQKVTVSNEKEGADGTALKVSFKLPDDVEQALDAFADHAIEQVKQWQKIAEPDPVDRLVFTVAGLLVQLACMRDKPDALQRAMDASVLASLCFLDSNKIGDGFLKPRIPADEDDYSLGVSPLFTALQFSSTRCVERLLSHARINPVLIERCTGSTTESMDLCTSIRNVQFMGATEPMALVMKHVLDKGAADHVDVQLQGDIVKLMGDVMNRYSGGHTHKNSHLLAAAGQAGWLDLKPVESLRQGLRHGFSSVIEHFKDRMPWGVIAVLSVMDSSLFEGATDDRRIQGFEALVRMAKDDGVEAKVAVLKHFERNEHIHPGVEDQLFMTKESLALLPRLLEIGLDPHAKTKNGTSTLLRDAKESDTEAANILSSFVARSLAHGMIEEMENSTKASHVPR